MHSKQKRWRQFRVQTGSPLLPSVSRQMAQDDNSDDDDDGSTLIEIDERGVHRLALVVVRLVLLRLGGERVSWALAWRVRTR